MILLLLATLLSGTPRGGDEDLELAVALARRGWLELAEELVERVRTDAAATPKARAALPLVAAEVAVEKARRAAEPAEAARILDGAAAALRPVKSIEARSTLGWVLGRKARALMDSADPAAARALEELEAFHLAFLTELKAMPSSAEVDAAVLESKFERSRSLLSRSTLPGIAAEPRRALLKEALDGFIDLQYDVAPPATWEAQLEEGRCLHELGENKKAEAKFQSLVDLQKLLPRRIDPADPRISIVQQATLGLSRSWLRLGNPKGTLALVDKALAQDPRLARTAVGLSLQLEKAAALQATQSVPAAIALAMTVDRADPTGPLGREARARMREWGGATPEVLLSLADAELAQGRPREALALLRQGLDVSPPAAHPPFLTRMGEGLQRMNRIPEAAAAFARVFREWPAHELSARAGVESARLLAREAFLTGAAADRERLEGLLGEIEKRGAGGDLTRFLQAEMAERKEKWREAADLFAAVTESSEFFGRAMISASYCARRAGGDLHPAETGLRRFLARSEGSPLVPVAWRELATVLLQLKQPKEALDCLSKLKGQDAARDLEIQALLAEGRTADAAGLLDRMLKESPDSTSTLRACRSVYKAMEPAQGNVYARRWLEIAKEPTVAELMDAADYLYRGARTLNGFGEKVASFVDLDDRTLKDRASWVAVAGAHRLLVEGGKLDVKDRLTAKIRLARSEGFLGEWEKAKTLYDAIIRSRKALDAQGQPDAAVIQAEPMLFSVYIELGEAYFELGKSELQKFQLDNSMTVFSNVLRLTQPGTVTWWHAKYRIITCLYERGRETDIRDARVLIENLERNNPVFDDGKFGMKPKFEELRDKIRKVSGR